MNVFYFLFTTWQGLLILWLEVSLILWLVKRNIPNSIKWRDRPFVQRFNIVSGCFLFPIVILVNSIDWILYHLENVLEFRLDFWRN